MKPLPLDCDTLEAQEINIGVEKDVSKTPTLKVQVQFLFLFLRDTNSRKGRICLFCVSILRKINKSYLCFVCTVSKLLKHLGE